MQPSTWECYAFGESTRIRTQQYKAYRTILLELALATPLAAIQLSKEQPFHLRFVFHLVKSFKWRDVSNLCKPAEDIICEAMGVDDRNVMSIYGRKCESKYLQEMVDVTVSYLPLPVEIN